MNPRLFWLITAILLAFLDGAEAQQLKIPRIGYLVPVSRKSDRNSDVFLQGLRDLGYIEGKNVLLEYRYAEGKLDRSPKLVAELLQLKVDIIVVPFLPGIRAAKEATKTIPIVMVSVVDPVSAGVIDSLAPPGGNIKGLASLRADLGGKRLELLKEVVPTRSPVIACLWDANAPGPTMQFKEYESAARGLNIQFQSIEVRGPDPDLEGAFRAIAKSRANALVVVDNPVLGPQRERIASFAHKNPTAFDVRIEANSVEVGGLISYAANQADLFTTRRGLCRQDFERRKTR